ncbi:MAG: response regulator, partial [Planctomycetota bacterium]
VHSCLSTAQGLIEGKQIQLTTEIEPGIPPLKTDQSKLRQVLINLLGNAAKFTEKGEISIKARFHPEKKDFIRISVSDTGPGIPEEQKNKLFESFTQADSSATRKHGGTGLGLAIVKKMTHLMHGEVFLESELGKGSTFYLDLPLDVYQSILGGEEDSTLGSLEEKSLSLSPKVKEMPSSVKSIRSEKSIQQDEKEPEDSLSSKTSSSDTQLLLQAISDYSPESFSSPKERESAETALATSSQMEDQSIETQEVPESKKNKEQIAEKKPKELREEFLDNKKHKEKDLTSPSIELIRAVQQAIENHSPSPSLESLDFTSKPTAFTKKSEEKLEPSYPSSSSKILFVIDDEDVVHEIYENHLENTEYTLFSCKDGSQAIPLLEKVIPYAIVLDIILKGANGWGLLKEIKEHPLLSRIPLIVSSNIDNIALLQSMGANYFLPKPVKKEKLMDILKEIQIQGRVRQSSKALLISHSQSPLPSKLLKALEEFPLEISLCPSFQAALQEWEKGKSPAMVFLDLLKDKDKHLQILDQLLLELPVLEAPLVVLYSKEDPPEQIPEIADLAFPLSEEQIEEHLSEWKEKLMKWIPQDRSSQVEPSSSARKKKKILIVEDVPDNMEFVCDVLEGDYDLVIAWDGKEGVEKALQEKPDLILMDLLLPNLDGLEATKIIRSNPDTSHIPIIALTAHAMVGDREKALKSGCVDYLTKPIVEEVLRKRVEEILAKQVKK